MSLTKEDLKAISDLMEAKLNEQDKRFESRLNEQDKRFEVKLNEQDKRFDVKLNELDKRFEAMLTDNNLLIAEHVQRVVTESEQRLIMEILEIKNATAMNSYDIATIKPLVMRKTS